LKKRNINAKRHNIKIETELIEDMIKIKKLKEQKELIDNELKTKKKDNLEKVA